ncbi:hypothetical protein G9A89_015031 [Geosiphon pyriformis]|nr:hypothetical protein G9A89_015031 [Geosiphon pyriformis]
MRNSLYFNHNEAPLQFSFWKLGLIFFGVPLAIYIYKCTMLLLFQNKLVYMPYIPLGSRREQFDEKSIDNRIFCHMINFKAKDGCNLAGIIARAKRPDVPNTFMKTNVLKMCTEDIHPIIIYFQGNAGNTILRLPLFQRILLSPTTKNDVANLTIVAPSYRGYWLSSGRPSEQGLKQDALGIFDYVQHHYPKNPIYLYGHSLGGCVTIYLASQPHVQDKIRGIILENTFTSIHDMIVTLYPQKWLPYRYLANVSFLIRNKWDNAFLIQEIQTPLLFLSSRNDEVVPQEQMLKLRDLAKKCNKKIWVEFEKGLHMDTFLQNGYTEAIKNFIKETSNCNFHRK